ncbi:ATP-dependent (S)-NAD(P)H-hydrate dehydratase-like [Ostrinia furnacalis]|uniref:ATP-dependent (S)-NAD(P)H-hydrate dehydratase-like n=1 Tax=Ostrinia furnacalis TaxID=93504 RepID=UPI0010387F8E|nr:ATP-dependent (S)-NAD(P)H-hydrate dehydratase-like [Ostrinia furnacalis]
MYWIGWLFTTFCLSLQVQNTYCLLKDECLQEGILSDEKLISLSKRIVPNLYRSSKGDSGKIGVIGGSLEYTGAPYFGALSALRVGADLVYVITTEQAAPVIKSYSPDLIVYPYFSRNHATNINKLLQKFDVVVIGPGVGRDEEQIKLVLDIIQACKIMKKALVIDADGLYAVSTNVSVLNGYPAPGVILTPNSRESIKLNTAINNNTDGQWHRYWGDNVSVLVKGHQDTCYCSIDKFKWALIGGGSARRVAGQGDILAGALGTFFNWALKADLCENEQSTLLAQSVAMYAASTFTRACNLKAFKENGRNMIASDMLKEIPSAFSEIFTKI